MIFFVISMKSQLWNSRTVMYLNFFFFLKHNYNNNHQSLSSVFESYDVIKIK